MPLKLRALSAVGCAAVPPCGSEEHCTGRAERIAFPKPASMVLKRCLAPRCSMLMLGDCPARTRGKGCRGVCGGAGAWTTAEGELPGDRLSTPGAHASPFWLPCPERRGSARRSASPRSWLSAPATRQLCPLPCPLAKWCRCVSWRFSCCGSDLEPPPPPSPPLL